MLIRLIRLAIGICFSVLSDFRSSRILIFYKIETSHQSAHILLYRSSPRLSTVEVHRSFRYECMLWLWAQWSMCSWSSPSFPRSNQIYGGWKKSCTSWKVVYPSVYRASIIQGGTWFLPFTVAFGQITVVLVNSPCLLSPHVSWDSPCSTARPSLGLGKKSVMVVMVTTCEKKHGFREPRYGEKYIKLWYTLVTWGFPWGNPKLAGCFLVNGKSINLKWIITYHSWG